jgi:hypothetical protein
MKKSEALLLAEIKKEFKAPIMEAIEPFAFAMIRARIPDTPATVQDETFITVYGTHEAGTKGSEGVTQKVTEEGEEIICDICGGEERVPLRTTIAARIDYVQKRIDFMQQGLERGFAVDPKTFVPDPKRKLSEAGRKALEDRITIFQDDIKYYNKLLAEVEKQGKGDEMIICPECGRGYIRWVEFPEYDDPTKRKKTKVPWKMLMDWLWKTLEDAGLEPIQGATVPGEAGFSSQKDRYGFTLKGDFPKQVTLATLSLGKTNRQVHERLAKILTAAQKGQPFKVEP